MSDFKLKLKGQRKGIKFNPSNDNMVTYAQTLGPIEHIVNEDEMREYFNDYVEWNMKRLQCTRQEAIDVCKINIGYFTGYFNTDTRARIERLLNVEHPILGSVKQDLTPDEILQIGIKMGEKMKGDSNSAYRV